MPRKKAPPRLCLEGGYWRIRDGEHRVRTGCLESDLAGAEKQLHQYITDKHAPQKGPDPLIVDVLLAYTKEHLAHTAAAKNGSYNIGSLSKWWKGKTWADVNPTNCRAYAATKSQAGARRDLETLRAAVNHWHRHHGPMHMVPAVILPPKSDPRDEWLTRSEVAGLLWASRGPIERRRFELLDGSSQIRWPHLSRFILIAAYTGSRSGAILPAMPDWVDLSACIMLRRAPGKTEDARKKTPRVRFGRRLKLHLTRWLRADAKAFGQIAGRIPICHYEGQRVRKLRRSFGTAAEKAGLAERATPHTLRHTRGTWLMQKGVDKFEAAGHLGMTMATLEKNYAHHHPDYQKEAAEI